MLLLTITTLFVGLVGVILGWVGTHVSLTPNSIDANWPIGSDRS